MSQIYRSIGSVSTLNFYFFSKNEFVCKICNKKKIKIYIYIYIYIYISSIRIL